MDIKPVKKTSISDDVIAQLKGMIVNQKIKIGEKLPNERELSIMFNVSRSSIREALGALQLQGLLDRRSSGTFVQAKFSNIIEESLTLELLMNNAKYEDIQVTRVMLERELVKLASTKRTDFHLANIKSFIEEMKKAIDANDKDEFVKADSAFHREIAFAADNFALLYLFNITAGLIFKVQKRVAYDEEVLLASLNYHEAIYQALLKKDINLAEEQMVEHLNDVERRIHRLNKMEDVALENFNDI